MSDQSANNSTNGSSALPAPSSDIKGRWKSWKAKNPIPAYLGLFIFFMAVFNLIRYTKFFEQWIYAPLVTANAHISSWILNIFGQETHADLNSIYSEPFDLSIAAGCDALTPITIFASVVLAFPATTKQKLTGAGLGIAFLLIINLVRIVALYFVGRYYHDWFEFMHVEFFQFLFILLGLICCGVWLKWVFKN